MADTITIDDGYGKKIELPEDVANAFVDEFGYEGPENGSSEGIHVDGYVLADDSFNDDDVRVINLSGDQLTLSYKNFRQQVAERTTPDTVIGFVDSEGYPIVLDADADFEISWNAYKRSGGNHHIVYYNGKGRVGASSGSPRIDQPDEYDYGWNFVNILTNPSVGD